MKKTFLLLIVCCLSIFAKAATTINTARVSGHWTVSGSPYMILNDITIDSFQSLEIDPGVKILFQGKYYITVFGSLIAAGSSGKTIDFTVSDTTGWASVTTSSTGGWHGIRFYEYRGVAPDKSILKYCNFSYSKFVGADYTVATSSPKDPILATLQCARDLVIKNCSFFKNKQLSFYPLINVYTARSTNNISFDSCTFYDNSAASMVVQALTCAGEITFKNSRIYNNNTINIIITMGSKLAVENCELFMNNTDRSLIELRRWGAGTVETASDGRITGNKIHHNKMKANAAIAFYSGLIQFERNLICNNVRISDLTCPVADGGAGILCRYEDSTVPTEFIIRNNIIANNSAYDYGGGIKVYGGNAIIANNHIINNKALLGCGIYFDSVYFGCRNSAVTNNIFYGNISTGGGPGNISGHCNKKIQYDHNWTQYPRSTDVNVPAATITGDNTTNIIGTNPGLTAPTVSVDSAQDAATADFSLSATSPCINKGDTTGLPATCCDYISHYRIAGSKIDIGAYEYGASSASVDQPFSSTALNMNLHVYPNPATNTISILTQAPHGSVTIQDISGRVMATQTIASTLTSMDVHTLPRGIYFLTWTDKGEALTEKISIR